MRSRAGLRRRTLRLAAVMTLGLFAVACGDSESDPDSAEVVPTSEPRTLDTGGGEQEVAPQDVVPFAVTDFSALLEPATYETTMSVRPIRFTIGDGWYLMAQGGQGFALARVPNALDEPFLTEYLGVVVVSEAEVPVDPLGGFVPGVAAEPVPDDLIGWYESIPGVSVTDPRPVTVGGVDGSRFELEIGPLPAGADCGGARCLVNWIMLEGLFFAGFEGNRSIPVTLLGEGEDRVMIGYSVDSPEMTAVAEDVISSMEFP